jgi:hypothetical protein
MVAPLRKLYHNLYLQLQILAALARAMSDGDVRDRLVQADSQEEMWTTLAAAVQCGDAAHRRVAATR